MTLGSDRAGIVLAGVCAVHCLATPLAIGLMPVMAAALEHPGIEWPLMLLSIGTSAGVVSRGCALAHRRWSALAWFGLGAGLLLAGRWLEESLPAVGVLAVVAGAGAIIGAHVMNMYWCRRACAAPAGAEG
jgi:hypothetical protein